MRTILFLHGLNWSGECPMAQTLRAELAETAKVIAPDIPVNPNEAMTMLLDLCDEIQPDLIVGSSYGAFLGQQMVKIVGVPAILCSPMFHMADFLETRIGWHDFKSPRQNGEKSYEITPQLIAEYREMEEHQFDCYDEFYRSLVWGFYGSQDTLAKTREEFLSYYSTVFDYDGPHTMTPDNVRETLAPAVRKILEAYPRMAERYFRHFKGNPYRLLVHAKDSETLNRMVTYQALYGKRGYWVRPEKMFFEVVTRNGKTFPRFSEILLAAGERTISV